MNLLFSYQYNSGVLFFPPKRFGIFHCYIILHATRVVHVNMLLTIYVTARNCVLSGFLVYISFLFFNCGHLEGPKEIISVFIFLFHFYSSRCCCCYFLLFLSWALWMHPALRYQWRLALCMMVRHTFILNDYPGTVHIWMSGGSRRSW